jgi:hypothetical protein
VVHKSVCIKAIVHKVCCIKAIVHKVCCMFIKRLCMRENNQVCNRYTHRCIWIINQVSRETVVFKYAIAHSNKQSLSLVKKNEHVFSPKTVIKTSKSRGYELTWCNSYEVNNVYTKWGTISNRNLIWMIVSNVRNEMMLHMQIRMLPIPLISFENNVYRWKYIFDVSLG